MKFYRPQAELTGKRLSANTLASFMAAQAIEDPAQIAANVEMPAALLRFLLRNRAISYWSRPENGWLKASPLERRVRPEGQKGAPSLEDVRSPRKSAGPRKRCSTARMIADGAWLASAGGQKGLESP